MVETTMRLVGHTLRVGDKEISLSGNEGEGSRGGRDSL
jgi:hypothetical protein